MSLVEMIRDMPLFARFTEAEKKAFAELDHSMLGFNEGDVIIKEGDSFRSMYLLVSGELKVTKGGLHQPLSELAPGALFGEMSFFTHKPRSSTVLAGSKAMVIKMDEAFFAKISPEMRDKILTHVIVTMAQRLEAMNEALLKIARFARSSLMF
ncbi:MAG: cyclic nucleotide-binding domain-containing protein [Thermodesulfobacteriota bacterium]